MSGVHCVIVIEYAISLFSLCLVNVYFSFDPTTKRLPNVSIKGINHGIDCTHHELVNPSTNYVLN